MDLKDILKAWQTEDTEGFKILVTKALRKGMEQEDILKYLEANKRNNSPNEEFEEWAYLLITSDGKSDCALG